AGGWLPLDCRGGRGLPDTRAPAPAPRTPSAPAMFMAWWWSFSRFGVIHGDPHLGNYSVFDQDGAPAGINLLDYGWIRIVPPKFVGGVADLYNALRKNDNGLVTEPDGTRGFRQRIRAVISPPNNR